MLSLFAAGGIALFIFPSLGHAYAGNWGRGQGLLAVELGTLVTGSLLVASGYEDWDEWGKQSYVGALLVFVGIPILKILEAVDAYNTASSYNSRLQEQYKLNLSLREGSTALRLSYAF